jgi:hypothetical protein
MTDRPNDVAGAKLPVPRIERSAPLTVTGRLKRAIDFMVWEGLTRDEAAEKAGLRSHSLYVALRKPHVKSFYLAECEVLRVSGRAKRLHRLEQLAMQDENKNAAVAAIKVADAIPDELQMRAVGAGFTPGVTIRIVNQIGAAPAAPALPAPQPRIVDAQPIEPDYDERNPIFRVPRP